jgi:hypothetical protein
VRTTVIPSLLKDSVSQSVLEKLDSALDEKKDDAFKLIKENEEKFSAMISQGEKKARQNLNQTVEINLPIVAAKKQAAGEPQLAQALTILNNPSKYPPVYVEAAQKGVQEARAKIAVAVDAEITKQVKENRKLLAETIKNYKLEVKEKIKEAREEKQAEIKSRIKELHKETTIQEVAIRLARKVNGNTAVYFQIGKMALDGAFITEDNRRTDIEDHLTKADPTIRLLSPYGSFAVGTGLIKEFQYNSGTKTWKLRADIAGYHYRFPFLNGNDYIASFLNASEEDYNKNKKLWNINTAFGRLLFELDRLAFFISGSYGEHQSWGTGFDWQFTDKNHLVVSFYNGNHNTAKQSISLYVTHEFSEQFAMHLGFNRIVGFEGSNHSWGSYDRNELVIGARYRFYALGHVELIAEAYAAQNDNPSEAHRYDSFKEEEFGARVSLTYRFPTHLEKLERSIAKTTQALVTVSKNIISAQEKINSNTFDAKNKIALQSQIKEWQKEKNDLEIKFTQLTAEKNKLTSRP